MQGPQFLLGFYSSFLFPLNVFRTGKKIRLTPQVKAWSTHHMNPPRILDPKMTINAKKGDPAGHFV